MTRYINFFPGNMRKEREIFIDEDAAYGMAQDIADFLDSMIKGCAASIEDEGIKAAIEDGALLKEIRCQYDMDETDLQEVVEELHNAI